MIVSMDGDVLYSKPLRVDRSYPLFVVFPLSVAVPALIDDAEEVVSAGREQYAVVSVELASWPE
jgi:hypothetical protein